MKLGGFIGLPIANGASVLIMYAEGGTLGMYTPLMTIAERKERFAGYIDEEISSIGVSKDGKIVVTLA